MRKSRKNPGSQSDCLGIIQSFCCLVLGCYQTIRHQKNIEAKENKASAS
jgi:hypothetical protein